MAGSSGAAREPLIPTVLSPTQQPAVAAERGGPGTAPAAPPGAGPAPRRDGIWTAAARAAAALPPAAALTPAPAPGAAPEPGDADEDDLPEHFVDELAPGTRLLHGQYRIEGFLNSGGFGITYLARDSLDRRVVIKECFPGAFCRRSNTIVRARSRAHHGEFRAVVRLFIQEARNLAKLSHPNIVGVHQVFEDNDTAYMAIDYIEGSDLLTRIDSGQPGLGPDAIVLALRKLLDAVAAIHALGMLHRDISPDNILIDRRGEPILIDFGAAREEASRASRALSALRVVKDGYSPQELYIAGSVQGPWSDLYALAASFHHLIAGEPPPDAQRRLAAIADRSPDPYHPLAGRFAGYPPGFLEAIDRAIKVLPRDRIQSAGEWLALLDRQALAEPAPAAKASAAAPAASPSASPAVSRVAAPRRPGLAAAPHAATGATLRAAALGVLLLALAAGGAGYVALGMRDTGTAAAGSRTGTPEAAAPADTAPAAPAAVAEAAAPAAPALAVVTVSTAGLAGVSRGATGAASARAAPPRPALPNPVVAARWDMALPFRSEPQAIGAGVYPVVTALLPAATGLPDADWLAPGTAIFSANGTWVADQGALERALFDLPGRGGAGVVLTTLRIREAEGGAFRDVTLAVPAVRRVVLADGTEFSTARVDGAWQLVVETIPVGEPGRLAPGDVILAERALGGRLEGPRGIETRLELLARAAVAEAVFVVRRGGQETVARLRLADG